MIYNAMGWEVPVWAHIPLIHGEDGKKLSKRHGALGRRGMARDGLPGGGDAQLPRPARLEPRRRRVLHRRTGARVVRPRPASRRRPRGSTSRSSTTSRRSTSRRWTTPHWWREIDAIPCRDCTTEPLMRRAAGRASAGDVLPQGPGADLAGSARKGALRSGQRARFSPTRRRRERSIRYPVVYWTN